jgi:hypothetical protein
MAGSTEKQQFTGSTYYYPVDIQDQEFFPESIKFTVYKRESASLDAVYKDVMDAVGESTSFSRDFDKLSRSIPSGGTESLKKHMEMQDAVVAIKNNEGDSSTFRTLIKYIDEDTFIGDAARAAKKIFTSSMKGLNQKHITDSHALEYIFLNMPNEISFTEPIGWEGADLGMVGALGKSGGSFATSGALSNLGNIIGGGTGALAGMFAGGKMAILGGLVGSLGGDSAQKGLELSFGNTSNPYKEMTFSGIDFREFSFNFVFRARSLAEVTAIKNIIKVFRRYSKPTYGTNRGIINYPEEFHIQFLTKDETNDKFITNEHIPQIKMCVCKNVTTNFSSQNTWKSFENGAPVEISLGLSFIETELVTGEDVMGDTQFGRFTETGRGF